METILEVIMFRNEVIINNGIIIMQYLLISNQSFSKEMCICFNKRAPFTWPSCFVFIFWLDQCSRSLVRQMIQEP